MKPISSLILLSAALLVSCPARAQDVSFQTQPVLQVASTIPGRTSVPNDLNGDGLSEMLFFSPTSSQLQLWFFSLQAPDESVLQRSMRRTVSITPGYIVGATGDLDSDGKADLVFTSPKHDLYLWKSTGDAGFVSRYLGTYPAAWSLLGSADMDGDGTDDLLWLNTTTCEFGYWSFEHGARKSIATFPVDCDFQPVAVGYYSLSKRASIIWTDADHNLVAWDGVAGGGFNHASLGPYPGDEFVYRLGGGSQGGGMYLMTATADSRSFSHRDFDRIFSIDGAQRSWVKGDFGGGGKQREVLSGGFMVRAQGFGSTAPIDFYWRSFTFDQAPSVVVCVPSRQAIDAAFSLEPNRTCASFELADGWVPIASGVALGKLPPDT